MQLFDFNIPDLSSGISQLFSAPESTSITVPSLSVQSLHHPLVHIPLVPTTRSINFADIRNLESSLALRKDPTFRTRVRIGDTIEVQLFEPENENFSWQIEKSGCGFTQTKSEWKFLFNSSNNFIYDKLPEEFMFPGTSIMIGKMFVKENVGVRKISLKADKTANKGNCTINAQYQRTE
mgnify:CR=1 FL=1